MDQKLLKAVVDDLRNRRQKLKDQLINTEGAIKGLQEVCEHKWVQTGHDSHKDHFVCEYCGATDAV